MKKKTSIETILAITIIICAMVATISLPQESVKAAPASLFGNAEIGTITAQNKADAQSVSYFTCTTSGPINDIMAYISGVWTGNCIAAIYAVSGGLPGALLEQSNPISIGTTFSWVNFHLPTPYNVTAGKTYGLAIMGDIAVNVMEVSSSGQRDDNAYGSYAMGFANPFGTIWNTDWNGAMSIYAASSSVEYIYAQSASVVLNLPQGGICNMTNIRFSVMDVSAKSTKGAEDYLEVAVWVPSSNKFSSIAAIDDNQVAVDSLKSMLSAVLLYFQVIKVDDKTIDVWKDGDSLMLNLTKPVNIMFGDPLPANSIYRTLNFTLPPLTLRFIQTGEVYEKITTPTTYPSGWSRQLTAWNAPGWANVQIPLWTGTTWMPYAAIYSEKIDIIATKP